MSTNPSEVVPRHRGVLAFRRVDEADPLKNLTSSSSACTERFTCFRDLQDEARGISIVCSAAGKNAFNYMRVIETASLAIYPLDVTTAIPSNPWARAR